VSSSDAGHIGREHFSGDAFALVQKRVIVMARKYQCIAMAAGYITRSGRIDLCSTSCFTREAVLPKQFERPQFYGTFSGTLVGARSGAGAGTGAGAGV
jgi:hypothetical protein